MSEDDDVLQEIFDHIDKEQARLDEQAKQDKQEQKENTNDK